MRHSIALDAGQSTSKLRATADHGYVTARYPGVLTDRPLPGQWVATVKRFLSEHPDIAPSELAIGSSGLAEETAHDIIDELAPLGIVRVALAHDSITCYLGSLGEQQGAMIAAGTGTICLGVGPRGMARVDGWGWIVGDAGSAFWIGRTAFEAALRGYDGRRRLTALTDLFAEDFPDLEKAYLAIQADDNKVSRIASYATTVNALASTDRVAANIIDKAAAHLSEAVQAALRRVGLNGPETPKVAALGQVFESDRLRNRFVDYLTLQWPSFALTEPVGDIVDGTAALLTLDGHHPLYDHVSFAERG